MDDVKPCFVLDACAALRAAQGEAGMEVVRDATLLTADPEFAALGERLRRIAV
jgi:hypothetical protein